MAYKRDEKNFSGRRENLFAQRVREAMEGPGAGTKTRSSSRTAPVNVFARGFTGQVNQRRLM